MFRAGHDAFGQLGNRLRLVTGGFVWRDEIEHQNILDRKRAQSTSCNFEILCDVGENGVSV